MKSIWRSRLLAGVIALHTRRAIVWLRPHTEMADVFALVGITALTRGLWMVYPPAAWIAAGLVSLSVVVIGVFNARRPDLLDDAGDVRERSA